MGVWVQKSDGTYKLNDYALSWDSTGQTFMGPARILQQVVLNGSGTGYSGTFSITQYSTDGTTVLQHVIGTVRATRVTVD